MDPCYLRRTWSGETLIQSTLIEQQLQGVTNDVRKWTCHVRHECATDNVPTSYKAKCLIALCFCICCPKVCRRETNLDWLQYENKLKQESIPVGCVRPTRLPNVRVVAATGTGGWVLTTWIYPGSMSRGGGTSTYPLDIPTPLDMPIPSSPGHNHTPLKGPGTRDTHPIEKTWDLWYQPTSRKGPRTKDTHPHERTWTGDTNLLCVDRMTHRCLWNHYLPPTSLAGGNKYYKW